MKICKILSILPLLFMLSAQTAMAEVMTKEQLFTKHGIVNNSIIPEDFDFETLRKIYASKYGEHFANDVIVSLQEQFILPEQYDGFYNPKSKVLFFEIFDNADLEVLNLSTEEILKLKKDTLLSGTETSLIARVGENIYLKTANKNDETLFASPLQMMVRKNDLWYYPTVYLDINECENIQDSHVHKCTIIGGIKFGWQKDAADYKPLADVLDRYYDFYKDYVHEYIMR